jgi:hypothetical protein
VPAIIKIGKLRKAISKIFMKNEKVRNRRNFRTKIRVEKRALNLVLEYLLRTSSYGRTAGCAAMPCRSTKFSAIHEPTAI